MKRFRRALLRGLNTAWREDAGQGALVIISVVVVAAGVAISQLSLENSRRTLTFEQSTRGQFAKIQAAIELYAVRDTATSGMDYLLPCPASGTAGTGTARSHNGNGCDTSSGDNRGIVPWSTLGLGQDDVTDGEGNYITYIVNSSDTRMCNGTSASSNALTDANGGLTGFVLISHGANGYGAFKATTNAQVNPGGASTNESDNCATVSGSCSASNVNQFRTGPASKTAGSTYFDDIVKEVSYETRFAAECFELADNLDDTTHITDSFSDNSGNGGSSQLTVTVTGGSSSSSEGGGVLTVQEDVEVATTSTNFSTDVTPLYMRIEWTPTAAATMTGFSIITRADRTTRSAGTSNYSHGITVDFFSDGDPANNQTIRIQENGSVGATSSGTYDLNLNTTYELEVFDDGTQVWGRITEVGNTSNQATVADGTANDTATPNQIIFLQDDTSGAISELNNLLVSNGAIVVELDNTDSLTAASDPTASFTSRTNFSEEAWLWLRDADAGTINMMQIDDAGVTGSIFRVSPASNQLFYSDNGGTNLTANRDFRTGMWSHVAFTCESGVNRTFVVNGSTVGSADTNACDAVDTTWSSQFVENSSGERILLSEIRQWSNRQDASTTGTNYNVRVLNTSSDLRLQLRLDDGQDGGAGTFPTDTVANDSETPVENFNITNGRFVSYRSPFGSAAEDVCPGFEDATDPYKCVYDGAAGGGSTTATVNIPLDITEVLIKAWGGGGGAGAGSAGGGGHAEGRFSAVGADNVSGNSLLVTAAGPGQGNIASGGGGGASAVRFSASSTTTLLIAGGGGGVGNRADNVGGAGGGTSGQDGSGSSPNGTGGNQTTGGTGSGGGSNGGNANLTTGANGGDGSTTGGVTAAGGTGFGDGGDGFGNDTGGGGGGYAGGGGGGFGAQGGAGGGGSGYFDPTNLTSGVTNAGSGATPGDSGDSDRGTAGNGATSVGAGNPGRVVICWSSSCLP